MIKVTIHYDGRNDADFIHESQVSAIVAVAELDMFCEKMKYKKPDKITYEDIGDNND